MRQSKRQRIETANRRARRALDRLMKTKRAPVWLRRTLLFIEHDLSEVLDGKIR